MPTLGEHSDAGSADSGGMTPPDGAPTDATAAAETSDSGETAQWRGRMTFGAADRTGERQRVHQSRRGGESGSMKA
ncbi:MAG: hypothetical protein ACLSIR_05135 [Christensenellales bacterium]